MQNFSPVYEFKGAVRAASAPSHNDDLVRKQDAAGLSYISSIHSDSEDYVEVDAGGALKIKNLLVTDVVVDGTAANLAAYVGTSPSHQKGDIVILTSPADKLMYIVKSGDGSNSADYQEIQSSITAAEIAGLLTGGTGISVSAAGAIAIDFTEFNTDNISQGSTNKWYASSLFNTDFNAKSTDNLTEGSSNLYYTDARWDSRLSSKTSDNLTEGSSNLYFTNARAQGAFTYGDGIKHNAGTLAIDEGAGLLIAGGKVEVDSAFFRYQASNQSLTANTFLTINHNLGEKYVHISVYDSANKEIQVDKELVDTNNCKIKSVDAMTGVYIIVSI